MRKMLLNDLSLKIFSVILAFVLWLVVMNISDYSITIRIDNIPVTQLNGDVLEELDKIYDVSKGDTVDIIVKGRRSVVEKLSVSDFVATADLSTMSITNTVQIFVSPKNKSLEEDITITCIDNTMTLNLEEKVTKQFPIKIQVEGTTSKKYAVCETFASPNILTVEGPKSSVERITSVVANINVNNQSSDISGTSEIYLYDAYGEQIINDKIVLSQTSVDVSAKILPTKTVDVVVDIKGTPSDSHAVTDIIYEPRTIDIAGTNEILSIIDSIVIDDISISGHFENLQTTVNIEDYLSDGVYLATPESEIVVNVVVEKLLNKTFTPAEKDFKFIKQVDGYKYELVLSDDFKIIASGVGDITNDINISDLMPTISCENMHIGYHSDIEFELKDIEGIEYNIIGTVDMIVSYSDQ